MSTHLRSCSALAIVILLAAAGNALAESTGDMCAVPKMKTDKWHSISAPAGMTLMIPPGYVVRGMGSTTNTNYPDSQFYFSGEHRWIVVGSGSGPSPMTEGPNFTEAGECETTIAGRRVTIYRYNWNNEDRGMTPSGDAGAEYSVVARFYSTATLREAYISYRTNIQSDVSGMRQIFWTASFEGNAPTTASAAPAMQGSGSAPATPAVACMPKPDPNLPALDAVLDTSTVQMLVANAAPPIQRGFEVISLKFNDQGGVSGIAVSESDFPDATQRQLTTLVASNLKEKDAKAPSTFLLRVETLAPGVRYQVLAPCAP